MVVERPNTGDAFLTRGGGGLQPQARLQLVVDGYSAPITAGNFIQNVQKGMYKDIKLNSSYISVLVGPQPKPGEPIRTALHSCPGCPAHDLCLQSRP